MARLVAPVLMAALAAMLWAVVSPAMAACVASCTLSGVVNDYWPGTANAAAGGTAITLGARRTGGGVPGQDIAAGDWVIVIQMQDAVYNSVDNANYGAANGTGRGYTQPHQTGVYEFAQAASAVGGGGGVLTLDKPLLNTYNVSLRATGAQTTPRFQVVRVPHCLKATLSGTLTGPHWNGTTGGVVALRGQTLDMGGATINAAGIGFRGGATDVHNDAVHSQSVTFQSTAYPNQYKGEGIAATPDYVYDLGSGLEIATGSVMPGGYRSKGAPGNAGGGGAGDAGGGGGGNGGGGGRGGVWNKFTTQAGRGGAPFTHSAASRLALGGGGGGGSAHPGQDGGATYDETRIPAGTGSNGYSRGGAGGGIVILGAATRSGSLTINADGTPGLGQFPDKLINYNQRGTQVGAGGGAGGSVALFGTGGSITVSAQGGAGYSMRAPDGFENYWSFYHYAHGGGGGGGAVWASSLAGISASVAGGAPGCLGARRGDDGTRNATNILGLCSDAVPESSETGGGGFANTFSGGEAGSPSCPRALLKVSKTNGATTVVSGGTTTYTIQVTNDGPADAPGTVLRDTPTAGLSCTGLTFSSTPPGAVTTDVLTVSALLSTGITLTPTFNANSTATFKLTCDVTATGLP